MIEVVIKVLNCGRGFVLFVDREMLAIQSLTHNTLLNTFLLLAEIYLELQFFFFGPAYLMSLFDFCIFQVILYVLEGVFC